MLWRLLQKQIPGYKVDIASLTVLLQGLTFRRCERVFGASLCSKAQRYEQPSIEDMGVDQSSLRPPNAQGSHLGIISFAGFPNGHPM